MLYEVITRSPVSHWCTRDKKTKRSIPTVITSYSIHYTKLYEANPSETDADGIARSNGKGGVGGEIDIKQAIAEEEVDPFGADSHHKGIESLPLLGREVTQNPVTMPLFVITSYSIHYTKLYDSRRSESGPRPPSRSLPPCRRPSRSGRLPSKLMQRNNFV